MKLCLNLIFSTLVLVSQSAISKEELEESAIPVEELEEVVVTGVRASLERSVELKRGADSVVDVITAEDLGKFPDTNVAESLQRVTGVAITRERGGEGQFVTIRGLGQQFNAVTYNSRLIATDSSSRAFSFDIIASELIANAEIYKAPQANHISGGIGGLINIGSARPFDYEGFKASGSIAGQYDDLADNTAPTASGVISHVFNETLGVLASVSYQQREVRTDVAESIGTFSYNIDANGRIDNPEDDVPVEHANAQLGANSLLFSQSERKRLGGTVALQVRPNEYWDIIVDALYTHYESPSQSFGLSYFPSNVAFFDPSVPITVTDDNVISSARFRSPVGAELNSQMAPPVLNADFLARVTELDTDTAMLGVNVKYDLHDMLSLSGDIAFSKSDGSRDNFGSNSGSGSFFVAGIPFAQVTLNSVSGKVPGFEILVPDSLNPVNRQTENPEANLVPLDQLNPDLLRTHFARIDTFEIDDEIFSVQFDADWNIKDYLDIKLGTYFVSRENDNRAINNTATLCEFCLYANQLRDLNPTVFDATIGNSENVSTIPVNNFLPSSNADIPRAFPAVSADAFLQLYEGVSRGPDNLVQAQPGYNALVTGLQFQPTQSSFIEEDVFAIYAQADMEGEIKGIPWRGNAGIRFERTKLKSSGAQNFIDNVQFNNTGQLFDFTEAMPVSFNKDYSDVLPSFNIAFDLTKQWVLRGALAATITRPSIASLSPSANVFSQGPGFGAINSFNPELKPIRSNNIDLSLEYYGENLSASTVLVYKDIENLISTVTTNRLIEIPNSFAFNDQEQVNNLGPRTISFQISRPENGDTAKITALELAAQYLFDNGFGFGGNVTFVDSEYYLAGVKSDLQDVSDFSYNLFILYEKDYFSARLAANFRDEYLVTSFDFAGPRTVDEFTSIDATASYNISDQFSIFLEGVNLTSEDRYTYSQGTKDLLRSYEEFGRRINLGFRATF